MTGGACPIKTSMHIYYDHADLLGSKHSARCRAHPSPIHISFTRTIL